MASLDNGGHNAIPRFIDVPGVARMIGIWRVKALSSSDTLTVPELDTRSASADQSSVRVLEPATGVTATAAATTTNQENVVTLAGASEGDELVVITVHPLGKRNVLAQPNPA